MNIKELKRSYKENKAEIKTRLLEFSNTNKENYLYELIFCLLTPQSNAEKCWLAVEELKKCSLKRQEIESCLRQRTRFYKNKAGYVVEAQKNWRKIGNLIYGKKSHILPKQLREAFVKEIKGLGMKEASHFLRNIGKSHNQLAILDRHILRKLKELRIIEEIPTLSPKNYLEIEKKMQEFSKKVKIPLDELDLLFWKLETGRIFK